MSILQILPKTIVSGFRQTQHPRLCPVGSIGAADFEHTSGRLLPRNVLLKLFIIGAVSACDTWLIHHFDFSIPQLEQNPVGRWLIDCGDGNVGVFIRTKIAGSVFVLTALLAMWRFRFRWAAFVTNVIALFQIMLLAYLFLA